MLECRHVTKPQGKGGRPPQGERALTGAERQARYRQLQISTYTAPPSPVRQDWLDRRKEPALEHELPIVETRITLEIDFASAGRR